MILLNSISGRGKGNPTCSSNASPEAGTPYGPVPILIDFDRFRENPATFNTQAVGGIGAVLTDGTFRYDDFAIYYDSAYNLLTIGLTVSIADRGKANTRRTTTMTTSVAIRNTF
jgi:hypothetical protein